MRSFLKTTKSSVHPMSSHAIIQLIHRNLLMCKTMNLIICRIQRSGGPSYEKGPLTTVLRYLIPEIGICRLLLVDQCGKITTVTFISSFSNLFKITFRWYCCMYDCFSGMYFCSGVLVMTLIFNTDILRHSKLTYGLWKLHKS